MGMSASGRELGSTGCVGEVDKFYFSMQDARMAFALPVTLKFKICIHSQLSNLFNIVVPTTI